jgi:WD40 repeat protein
MNIAVMHEPRRFNMIKLGMVFLAAAFFIILLMLAVAFMGPNAELSAKVNPAAPPIQLAAFQSAPASPLLVWVANGSAPGKQGASDPGQLAYVNSSGVADTVLELPQGTSRVESCGEAPTSPDGKLYAFYVGQDKGSLYVMRGSDKPAKVGDIQALSCLGNGTFQYAPGSNRFGYISYEGDAKNSEFADGFLHVINSSDFTELYKYENVTAFDLTDNGAAFVSFFTNDKNEADEAAVIWWDGTKQQEVATLKPASEDCKFTSASVTILPDGKLMLILGHRCKKGDTTTNWQLYSVNPTDKSATLAASASQKGAFAAFARSNNIYLSTDGKQALFSVPDGVTANTVGLKRVSLADLSISDVIDKEVVAATYNGSANAFPRVSPDGKWLAAVVSTPNAANNVYVWSLTDPTIAPIMFSAGSKGDTVSSMAFTPDSSHLLAVVGGDNKANNSLVSIEVATGQNSRVARGHFDKGLTISADGTQAALLDWQIPEDTAQHPYLNLINISLADGSTTTLYTGADIVDGKVKNERFAYPMAWVGGAAGGASG